MLHVGLDFPPRCHRTWRRPCGRWRPTGWLRRDSVAPLRERVNGKPDRTRPDRKRHDRRSPLTESRRQPTRNQPTDAGSNGAQPNGAQPNGARRRCPNAGVGPAGGRCWKPWTRWRIPWNSRPCNCYGGTGCFPELLARERMAPRWRDLGASLPTAGGPRRNPGRAVCGWFRRRAVRPARRRDHAPGDPPLPGLRRQERHDVVSACDPLNLVGIVTPSERCPPCPATGWCSATALLWRRWKRVCWSTGPTPTPRPFPPLLLCCTGGPAPVLDPWLLSTPTLARRFRACPLRGNRPRESSSPASGSTSTECPDPGGFLPKQGPTSPHPVDLPDAVKLACRMLELSYLEIWYIVDAMGQYRNGSAK